MTLTCLLSIMVTEMRQSGAGSESILCVVFSLFVCGVNLALLTVVGEAPADSARLVTNPVGLDSRHI